MKTVNRNCLKCEYFFVTWDRSNPRGCSYFGFKTAMIPSQYVRRSSGEECRAFVEKKARQ